jgi:site-specific DNA-methyltransferase (adenine-specific)
MDLKKYKVILCDPPWTYTNWRGKDHGAAKAHYKCMKVHEIASLPVHDIGGENCALLMWITFPKLVEAAHVPIMQAWNFRPVTAAFMWRKRYASGKPYMGLGFYTRSAAEPCILGIRGSMPPLRKDVMQVIEAPRTQTHSTKPEEIYTRTEALFPGPYIELFARKKRSGWDAFGYELDGQLIDEAIVRASA